MSSSRREGTSIDTTGRHRSMSQPGTSTPHKLRAITALGFGEVQEVSRRAQRLFRLTAKEEDRPPPHVMDAGDVTNGLGLVETDAGRITDVLERTRADFASHPQLRVQRILSARQRLSEVLRTMKQLDGHTRMEIQRRALAYWKKFGMTDYQQPPRIRHTLKSAAPLLKGGGPYIGPRGGKYADSNHTIPWHEGAAKADPNPQAVPGVDHREQARRAFNDYHNSVRAEVRKRVPHTEAPARTDDPRKINPLQQARYFSWKAKKKLHQRKRDKQEASAAQDVKQNPTREMHDAHSRFLYHSRRHGGDVLKGWSMDLSKAKPPHAFGAGESSDEDGGKPSPAEGTADEKVNPGDPRKPMPAQAGNGEGGPPNGMPDKNAPLDDDEFEDGEGDEGDEFGGGSPETGTNGQEDDPSAGNGKLKFEAKDHPETERGGHHVHLHDDVHADLPDDADFQHHATEHAKHTTAYLVHKDGDGEKAEAHRHAANMHARLGNSMHNAGQEFRGAAGGMGPEEPVLEPGADAGGPLGMVGPDGAPPPQGPDMGQPGAAPPGANGAPPGAGPPGARPPPPGPPKPANGMPPQAGANGAGAPPQAGPPQPPRRPAMKPSGQLGFGKGERFTFAKAESRLVFKPHVVPVNRELRKAGGPYVGPKGGKWADPAHSIPWKEGKKGSQDQKHHEVHAFSTSRHRASAAERREHGGATVTRFTVQDPTKPAGQEHHQYEGKGKTPSARRSHALEQHKERHGIEKDIKHVDFDKRRRKHAHGAVKQTDVSGKKRAKVQLAMSGGAREVTAAIHGQWAAHRTQTEGGHHKSDHSVTHVPSGLSVKRDFKSAKEARSLAQHLSEHPDSKDALGESKFGQVASGWDKDEVSKLKNAVESHGKEPEQGPVERRMAAEGMQARGFTESDSSRTASTRAQATESERDAYGTMKSEQYDLFKAGDIKWITVSGAHIPIKDGKMSGPVADKIRGKGKKKKLTKIGRDIVSGKREAKTNKILSDFKAAKEKYEATQNRNKGGAPKGKPALKDMPPPDPSTRASHIPPPGGSALNALKSSPWKMHGDAMKGTQHYSAGDGRIKLNKKGKKWTLTVDGKEHEMPKRGTLGHAEGIIQAHHSKSVQEGDLLKAKYTKRTGMPGSYRYEYEEEKSSNAKQLADKLKKVTSDPVKVTASGKVIIGSGDDRVSIRIKGSSVLATFGNKRPLRWPTSDLSSAASGIAQVVDKLRSRKAQLSRYKDITKPTLAERLRETPGEQYAREGDKPGTWSGGIPEGAKSGSWGGGTQVGPPKKGSWAETGAKTAGVTIKAGGFKPTHYMQSGRVFKKTDLLKDA